MAEFATAAATSAAGKVAGNLFDLILNSIWSRITRVFKWEANVENLKENVAKLEAEKERVLQFKGDADRRGKEVVLRVNNWLTRADNYIGEMEKLGVITHNARKCFARVCPNPKARYQISKKVEEYLVATAQLLEEVAKFKIPDSYYPSSQKISTIPVKDYEDFGTRMSVMNGIMEVLRSASVDKIGVYGMPGVGKTTLAKEVARQAVEAQLFEEIVMASMKKNPDMKRVQGEIADQLGVQLHGETEFGRACQLKAYLRKKKRILVILDDIWMRVDLDELGIPFEDKKNEASSIGEEQVQCKILFTSRFLNVLSCDMRTHKDFEVGRLQDEEAWELFKKIVGNEIEKSDLRPTAMEIVKECAGLPLAVEALANALKCRSPHVWRDALRELERPSPKNFTGRSANVYSAVEMSYKHLEKELQQTFLLCSILGHNASIEDVMKYGIGLDLFHNVVTIGEARDRVLTLVSNLNSCSLLLNGCNNIHFDMHDIVRDVAISLASRDHHVLSLMDNYVPKEWSDRGALEGFKWISLQHASISELPDELECPQLTLFCLCSKDPFMKIPENLFRRMQKLRVLNFSKLHFSSLPSSICLLKNLQTLHVNESVLKDVATIGKLTSLEVLSLSGCDIKELPMEIGQLTQLKLLDLSDCTKLEVIRPHILASLSRLEELYLRNSFNQWGIEEEDGNQTNASLAELKDLQNMAALDVHVSDVQLIPEGLFSERLDRYKIFIGEVWNHWDSSFKSSKVLKLELDSINYADSIGMLLKKTEELHLKELKGVKNLVYEVDAGGFQKLKYLYIQDAPEVQHIINSVEWAICYAFPILEALLLLNMNNLVKICHGCVGATSFSRLRVVTVECCNQLKTLFPFSVARQLLQLKEIRVTDCSNIVEIVDKEGQGASNGIAEANENFELVQLQSLKLQCLPNFISLCRGIEETNDSSSNNTAPLFNEKIVFPNLEELQLSWINIKSIWSSQLSVTSSCIQSLTKLIIEGCDHLEHLLSFSMAKNLVQLRCLQINKCKMMREVIEPENAEEMEDLISFPKLDILKIEHLANLTTFCSGNCSVEFTSVKQLYINNCPKLKGFTINHTSADVTGGLETLFNEKVVFPSLERLTVFHLENCRIIWHHQLPADSFCKLKSLSILSCERLLTIFPSIILRRLCTSLEKLEVYLCGCLEAIFELGELNVEESHALVDTQLRRLSICQLPRLKHIWSKDPLGILTFRNLQSVKAVSCLNLQTLFPASVGMDLQQLEKLELIGCGIEEVVALGGESAVPRFEFSNLSSLGLWYLPRLKYFYPRKHTIEWPMLKKFSAFHCEGVKETNGESLGKFPVQLRLFSIEKVIPRLEKLSLTSDDIAMICNFQFQGDIFSKVRVLRILCYHDESPVFPIFFLERFCNLEKLQITCCNFKELFTSVASIDCQKKDLGSIRKLKLKFLSNLKYIWSKDSELSLLQNVESLKVEQCDSLISISESKASFQNLTTLSVYRCQVLRNLFSLTTAQSLAQLQTMTVSECHLLNEIVGDEGDSLLEVIVFSKLKVLELKSLIRLASFSSGSFTFTFPLLEQVTVTQCPNFETFCHGVLKTPRLQRIQLTDGGDLGRPVVELNNTINHLYKEKVGYAGLQYLKLSEFPKLMEIWNKNPQEILDFRSLSFLEICNCGDLRYLLTPSMALSLVVLQKLKVQNCEMMEHIIIEEGAIDVVQDSMIFPCLKFITLESCSNLTSFFVGSYKIECISLIGMNVLDCPKMAAFALAFSTVQVKEAADGRRAEMIGNKYIDISSESFFGDQVELSNFLQLHLSFINMQQLFHSQLSAVSSVVQSLGHLNLEGCNNLKYLFTSSMIKSLVQLKYLDIRDCKMMEEVIVIDGLAEERMLFPNLRTLILEGLMKLSRFSSGNYFVFPFLIHLYILKCPLMETFISSSTIGDIGHMKASKRVENTHGPPLFDSKVAFPSLENLIIKDMGSLDKIWHEQLDANSFYKLEGLIVGSCEKLVNIFPFDILERLHNLDQLQILNCTSLVEIFEPQELSGTESQAMETAQSTLVETATNFALPKLTWLQLLVLPKLKSIYPRMHTAEWPSMKKLSVVGCDQIEIFASELLSFPRTRRENQQEIQIQCPLFCVSKATFPSLEELVVERNQRMKEIWHGDCVKDGIVFPKLETLQLKVLPRLESFCPRSCNFEFPSLKDVIVMECPNMLTFCEGAVSTPKLQKVKLTEDEDEGCWEGGLNPTIQQLSIKKSVDDSSEDWSHALHKLFN